MSQQKVDKYKERKANRIELMKKEKRNVRLEILAMASVVVVLMGWFGYSYLGRVAATKPPKEYVIDSGAVDDYLTGLTATEEPVEEQE